MAIAFLVGGVWLAAAPVYASGGSTVTAIQAHVDLENIFCLPSRNDMTSSNDVFGLARELSLLPEKACQAYRAGTLSAQEYRTLLLWLPPLTVAYVALDGLEAPQFAGVGESNAAAIRSIIRGSPPYRLFCPAIEDAKEYILSFQEICFK